MAISRLGLVSNTYQQSMKSGIHSSATNCMWPSAWAKWKLEKLKMIPAMRLGQRSA